MTYLLGFGPTYDQCLSMSTMFLELAECGLSARHKSRAAASQRCGQENTECRPAWGYSALLPGWLCSVCCHWTLREFEILFSHPTGRQQRHLDGLCMTLVTPPETFDPLAARSSGHAAVNILGALLLLMIALPFLVIIPVLIKLTDGGPVFYRSLRLGLGKKTFWMYKFRSLKVGAHDMLGAELLKKKHKLETPIGGFLRDTRLDELPQLLNVFRADMDLIGPRPERPEVYQCCCQGIKGYDLRFRTRPGVIGYAQLFTPHATPKRLRSLIDTYFVTREPKISRDVTLLGHAIAAIIAQAMQATTTSLLELWRLLLGGARHNEQRQLRRFAPSEAFANVAPLSGSGTEVKCRLVDLNEEAVLINCNTELTPEPVAVRLTCFAANGRWQPRKLRTVHCVGKVRMSRKSESSNTAVHKVIRIEPLTPLNEFKLYKYFLRASIS